MHRKTEDHRIRGKLDEIGLTVCNRIRRRHQVAVGASHKALADVVDFTGVAACSRLHLCPGLVLPGVQRGRNTGVPGYMAVKRSEVDINPPSRIFLECRDQILAALETIRILKEMLTAIHDAVVVRIHEPAVQHVVIIVCCHNRQQTLCLEIRVGVTLACAVVLQHTHLEGVRAVCLDIRGNLLGRVIRRCHIVGAQGSELGAADSILTAVELDIAPRARISRVAVGELHIGRRHLRLVVLGCRIESRGLTCDHCADRVVAVRAEDVTVALRHREHIALDHIIGRVPRHRRRDNVLQETVDRAEILVRNREFLPHAGTGIVISNFHILVRHHTVVIAECIRTAGQRIGERIRIGAVCRIAVIHRQVIIAVANCIDCMCHNRQLRLHHRGRRRCDRRAGSGLMIDFQLEARMRRIHTIAPGNRRILTRETTCEVAVGCRTGHIVKGTERRRRGLIAKLIGRRIRKGIRRCPDITRDHLAVTGQRILDRVCRRNRRGLEDNATVTVLIGRCVAELDAVVDRINRIVNLRRRREGRRNRHRGSNRAHTALIPAEEIIAILDNSRRYCVGRIAGETAEWRRCRRAALCIESNRAVLPHILVSHNNVLLRHETGDFTKIRARRRIVQRKFSSSAGSNHLIRLDTREFIRCRGNCRLRFIDSFTCRKIFDCTVLSARHCIALCILVLECNRVTGSAKRRIVCSRLRLYNRCAIGLVLIRFEEVTERSHTSCAYTATEFGEVLFLRCGRCPCTCERTGKIVARSDSQFRDADARTCYTLHHGNLLIGSDKHITLIAVCILVSANRNDRAAALFATRKDKVTAGKVDCTLSLLFGARGFHRSGCLIISDC